MFDLSYDQQKALVKDIPRPFCFLDLDRLDKNIELAKSRSESKLIRVACKSVRSVDVLKYIQKGLGEQFCGLMTFTVNESLELLSEGFDHCLMGYPQRINESQAERIKELSQSNKKLVLMIDSPEHVHALNEWGKKIGHTFEVCVDIDLSLQLPALNFGVYRSPLRSIEQARILQAEFAKSSFLKCVGVMGYEAQVAGVQDVSGKGKVFDLIVGRLKKLSEGKILKYRAQIAELFGPLEFVNGGGTGSLSFTTRDDSVTEVTIGSGFYTSHLFDGYFQTFNPSCGYAIEVCRKPRENYITCHGGGYIASGALDINKIPKVFSPKGLEMDSNEMFGEVQTPFKNTGDEKLEIGDPIFVRHSKAGELMERFRNINIIKAGKIIDTWKTYRGEGKCYL